MSHKPPLADKALLMDNETRKCADCGGNMSAIKVIDKQGGFGETAGFEYAAVDAQRGFWSSTFPKSGKVDSYLCHDCGGVRLYAVKST
jgi:hypothetical protein|tara:strand:+ start:191 stop:454 length:264 start_codon:yes stop_codon:yes gene_type:complete